MLQNHEPTASQNHEKPSADALDSDCDFKKLAQSFQAQGDKLAEDGKYRKALGKWEAALNLMPEHAVLFEQKAQVLLELGDA
ncbi:putative Chalcone synthase [Hibiscus syriacus]|uniref:Chalcone synthase n=1 Tax=Hibiscus syriacus TaxID=106335 RepID=A0A6A3BK80_HIBSY|nr:putative Chalcone synthase [Hibiscus syriacus]